MNPEVAVNSPFVVLSFLAAPAILTNACTLLALGTSNRLARAADRARATASAIVASRSVDDPLVKLQRDDFRSATLRAQLLVKALQRFYLAAGCFAAGTCIALIGAFLDYFAVHTLDRVTQIGTVLAAVAGVGGLVHGTIILLRETRIALHVLDQQHAAITTWQATHQTTANLPAT